MMFFDLTITDTNLIVRVLLVTLPLPLSLRGDQGTPQESTALRHLGIHLQARSFHSRFQILQLLTLGLQRLNLAFSA
jgi:hypothetical protein